jgi:hypothetical protein
MKRSHFLLRIATVVSAMLLAGGFVAYRAGAFDWLNGKSPGVPESGEKPAAKDQANEKPKSRPVKWNYEWTPNTTVKTDTRPTFLVGPKSAPVFVPQDTPPTQKRPTPAPLPDSKQPQPSIMPSSKSGMIAFPKLVQ